MRNAIKKINYYAHFISAAALVGLMLLTVVDVVVRKFLQLYMPGSFELTGLLLTLIVLFGVAYANDYKEHVVIDFVYERLPQKGKWIFSVISSLLTLAIIGLMCYVVFKYGVSLMATGAETSALKIPYWPIALCGGVGLAGFTLSIIGDLIFIIKDKGVLGNDPS